MENNKECRRPDRMTMLPREVQKKLHEHAKFEVMVPVSKFQPVMDWYLKYEGWLKLHLDPKENLCASGSVSTTDVAIYGIGEAIREVLNNEEFENDA